MNKEITDKLWKGFDEITSDAISEYVDDSELIQVRAFQLIYEELKTLIGDNVIRVIKEPTAFEIYWFRLLAKNFAKIKATVSKKLQDEFLSTEASTNDQVHILMTKFLNYIETELVQGYTLEIILMTALLKDDMNGVAELLDQIDLQRKECSLNERTEVMIWRAHYAVRINDSIMFTDVIKEFYSMVKNVYDSYYHVFFNLFLEFYKKFLASYRFKFYHRNLDVEINDSDIQKLQEQVVSLFLNGETIGKMISDFFESSDSNIADLTIMAVQAAIHNLLKSNSCVYQVRFEKI